MGAVTVAPFSTYGYIPQNLGHRYWTGPWLVTMSASYATGGDTITPAQLGYGSQIDTMITMVGSGSFNGPFWLFQLNIVNENANPPVWTIQAFGAATGATGLTEAAAANAGINSFVFGAFFVGV